MPGVTASWFSIARLNTNAQNKVHGNKGEIAGGDTLTPPSNSRAQMLKQIHGIDCPEKKKPFGQVAKQFACE